MKGNWKLRFSSVVMVLAIVATTPGPAHASVSPQAWVMDGSVVDRSDAKASLEVAAVASGTGADGSGVSVGEFSNGLASSDNPEQDVAGASAQVLPAVQDQVVSIGGEVSDGLVKTVSVPELADLIAADAMPAELAGRARTAEEAELVAELVTLDEGVSLDIDAIAGPESDSPGIAFALSIEQAGLAGDSGWVNVEFDLSDYATLYGGGYGSRIQLYAFPACVLTRPDEPGCDVAMPLGSSNNGDSLVATIPVDPSSFDTLAGSYQGQSVSGLNSDIGISLRRLAVDRGFRFLEGGGGTIIVGAATASGATGNFKATDLPQLGAWSMAGNTGAFSYQVPLEVPPTTAGPVPDLTLSYNSAAIDGRNAAQNGQSSWVGEGWNLEFGYIERLFIDCQIDWPGNAATIGDTCWRSPFNGTFSDGGASIALTDPYERAAYVLNLGGATHELMPSGNQTFVAKDDPSIKVTRVKFANAAGTEGEKEYFVVETPDGSLHYFGYGAASPAVFGSNQLNLATDSTLKRPVVGDDTGEPCNGVSYCNVGYRWMVDFVADSAGNAMAISYAPEINRVKVLGTTDVSYTRAALPKEVLYGLHGFDPAGSTTPLSGPEARVRFNTVSRCVELAVHQPELLPGSSCPPLAAENRWSYPDVPIDLICVAGTSCSSVTHRSASFFTTKRLASVVTEVRVGNVWESVAEHRIIGTYPLPQEASGSTLWLDAVYTVYSNGTSTSADDVTTYAYAFDGIKLPNRVDFTSDATKLEKRRVERITTPLGGQIAVTYRTSFTNGLTENRACPSDGVGGANFSAWSGNPKVSPWANTWDCYRVTLTSTRLGGATDTYALYHHYVVQSVKLRDPVAGTPEQVFSYTYVGNPGWSYEYPLLYTEAEAIGTFNWSDFVGYREVRVTTGSGETAVTTATQYFQGLDGAYAHTSPALVSKFTPWGSSTELSDDYWLRGREAASRTWNGSANQVNPKYESVTHSQWALQRSFLTTSTYLRAGTAKFWFPVSQVTDTALRSPQSQTPLPDVRAVVSTQYDSTLFWLPIAQSSDADTVVAGDERCTQTSYVARRVNAAGVDLTMAPGVPFGSGSYLIAPVSGASFDGACGTGVKTGAWETWYDGSTSVANQALSVGLATTEKTWTADQQPLTATATYDSFGRMIEARTPANIAFGSGAATQIAYSVDGASWKRTVTNAAQHVSTSWFDPATGNVLKSEDANGLFTHYRYDAAGRLTSAWAPAQLAADPAVTNPASGPASTTVPTVSYLYDMDAQGLAVRKRPVAVATAQYVGWNAAGSEIYYAQLGRSQRSYVFYDGFGRQLQQHTVAADGSGGRLVTAQSYDAQGNITAQYSPYFDAMPAQFSSGLAALPSNGDRTTNDFDWAGRATSSTVHMGATALTTQTAYYGRVTVTEAPSGLVTHNTVDSLGRTIALSQFPADDSTPVYTTYDYGVIATGDQSGYTTTTVTDAEGGATVFTADWAGRKVSIDDPNAGVTTYSYNPGGQVTAISSAAGSITLAYDALGRMTERTSTVGGTESSSAQWTYDGVARVDAGGQLVAARGVLTGETSTTVISSEAGVVAELSQTKSSTFDSLMRPKSSKTVLGDSALLGDLSEAIYESTVTYDALGRVESTTGGAFAGLEQHTSTLTYDNYGRLFGLSVGTSQEGGSMPGGIDLVTGTSFDALGRPLGRTYGNGVRRSYTWDPNWNAISEISASYGEGAALTYVQKDEYTRDALGRVASIADNAQGQGITQCYAYDGLNRLASAHTTTGACGSLAVAATGDLEELNYDVDYTYSATGRILSVVNSLVDVTSSYDYDVEDTSSNDTPAAVKQVSTEGPLPSTIESFDGLDSEGAWVDAGVISSDGPVTAQVVDGALSIEGAATPDVSSVWSRQVDVDGVSSGSVSFEVTAGSVAPAVDDVLTLTVTDVADASRTVSVDVTGADVVAALAAPEGGPLSVSLDVAPVLPAEQVVVSLQVARGSVEGDHGGFVVDNVEVTGRVLAVSEYVYDSAGRMTQRSVGGQSQVLRWDVLSSVTSTVGVGGSRVYAYDASGARWAQVVVDELTSAAQASQVTVYVADVEVTDTTPGSAGGVSATRFVTFGGATVATVTSGGTSPVWALLLGDGQGSAQVSMSLTLGGGVTGVVGASAMDVVSRNAYEPFGSVRGSDNLAVSRGWLGQVSDADTGLLYLNARYYDPVLARFISPDPLMNPGDPKTLDPYRYADNNPVMMTDATGLFTRTVPLIDGVAATKGGLISQSEATERTEAKYNGGGKPNEHVNLNPRPPAKPSTGSGSTGIGLGGDGTVVISFWIQEAWAGVPGWGFNDARGDNRGPATSSAVMWSDSRFVFEIDRQTGNYSYKTAPSCDWPQTWKCFDAHESTVSVSLLPVDETLFPTLVALDPSGMQISVEGATVVRVEFDGRDSATRHAPPLEQSVDLLFTPGTDQVAFYRQGDAFPSMQIGRTGPYGFTSVYVYEEPHNGAPLLMAPGISNWGAG